jgi:hypothetical protein
MVGQNQGEAARNGESVIAILPLELEAGYVLFDFSFLTACRSLGLPLQGVESW